jgi:hypothetical protein
MALAKHARAPSPQSLLAFAPYGGAELIVNRNVAIRENQLLTENLNPLNSSYHSRSAHTDILISQSEISPPSSVRRGTPVLYESQHRVDSADADSLKIPISVFQGSSSQSSSADLSFPIPRSRLVNIVSSLGPRDSVTARSLSITIYNLAQSSSRGRLAVRHSRVTSRQSLLREARCSIAIGAAS